MDNCAPLDIIGQLIADVDASGVERSKIAADAGLSPSQLNSILERKQAPTVPEYLAIRKAIGAEPEVSEEVAADLERLRAAMQRGEELGDVLEDLLRRMDRDGT